MEEMKQVLENINVIYREKLKEISDLKYEIFEINKKLINRDYLDIIKHKEYVKLKADLEYLEDKLEKEQSKADGMFIAREEVLNVCCKIQNK